MLALSLLLLAAGQPDLAASAAPVAEFALPDSRGTTVRLADLRERELIVVVFLGADCPLARLYGPRLAELARTYDRRGVAFLGIDANASETPVAIARYATDHRLPFPVLIDADHAVADQFGAERTPEAFVLDRERRVRYRGRIDGQYTPGLQRPQNPRADLAMAIEDLLAGRAVAVPATEVTGCVIDRGSPEKKATSAATYTRDVAPILQRRCQSCHRPGEVAPFSLLTYRQAAGRAATIREVVADGRMPPWHADPRHGRFANDPTLSDTEKWTIVGWIDAGCPEGAAADLPPPVRFPEGWSIKPDRVIPIPAPFAVPAEGLVDYQYFSVDPGFTTDVWVQAAEIRPGNRAVVHHCSVFLQRPEQVRDKAMNLQGELGSFCLAAYAPGTPPLRLPAETAKCIPAGMRMLFVVHYTPTGKPEMDETKIGLVFADAKAVRKEVATRLIEDVTFAIPPGAADFRLVRGERVRHDVLLLALFPHMHLRGKSFRYEAVYPDGDSEILLDVPRYDFAWQNRYELQEPKRLPRGTEIRCTAVYDNSSANPANPDPTATVRAGLQNTDEMFNGYCELVLADEDRTRNETRSARSWVIFAAVAAIGLLLVRVARRPSVS
ncbi:MAG TPA: redoxin domain-containing protein [Gemmataceae bacterium]|nr:redoxin domain-containing protein [Gemmataceae bacterium]